MVCPEQSTLNQASQTWLFVIWINLDGIVITYQSFLAEHGAIRADKGVSGIWKRSVGRNVYLQKIERNMNVESLKNFKVYSRGQKVKWIKCAWEDICGKLKDQKN